MKVFINDEQVDITWQDEKNLGDAYLGVQQWLQDSGLAVQSVSADGDHKSLGEFDQWEHIPMDEIEELRITALHPLILEQQQLVVVLEYFDLLSAALEQSVEENALRKELGEILQEWPHVLSGLRHLLGETSDIPGFLQDQMADWIGGNRDVSGIPELLSRLTLVHQVVTTRIQEYQNPLNESVSTLSVLQELQPQLAKVSHQYREGHPEEAQNTMYRLIDLLSKLARTLRLATIISLQTEEGTIDHDELDAAGNQLNSLLDELAEGIENQDLILLGDILEYELPEQFERLSSLLQGA
ncbi:hypothetical protein [Spirochaeta lutea]|uniref:Uncharacterized protein n=1 Tax=Spirochaeta lutea TaxID=1480694 RepID=A0A098R0R0_9SPIO|nr:hypothetical protein [Spirochaeta lutea]KGE73569.1 hypothetical protein DC28_02615 [Spirochaeta lutea]